MDLAVGRFGANLIYGPFWYRPARSPIQVLNGPDMLIETNALPLSHAMTVSQGRGKADKVGGGGTGP